MARLKLEDLKPIVATCAKCGADGLIHPQPSPRGSFQCPNCNVPALARPILLTVIARLKAGPQAGVAAAPRAGRDALLGNDATAVAESRNPF